MKNIAILLQIMMLILELIKKGLDENEVIDIVASEFKVSSNFVRNIFK